MILHGRLPKVTLSVQTLLIRALTFEQVVTQSELIVEGEIEEVLLDGLAYRLAVDEVFKGASAGTSLRIGPELIRATVDVS